MTSPEHARLNERVLNHWEQEREGQIQSVAAELVREARAVQDALEAFARELTEASHPQERRRFGFL
ncbi:hypothetical protein ACFP9V_06625 [Deinococcus radiopugnans]|uniref:hypothetical protein n=1 Tax=Deinococcus radiopugnans TaxID=57497 RepID=UPI003609991A